MRPTGRLHIGHYFGALQNWVRLQNDPAYECFYFIADWHALTSDYADTSGVAENTLQIMIDYLAAGLDPEKSVLFQQSVIPEHAELHLLLSMVTPLGWLERVPTYKEALENVKDKDLHNYGFLGYPILQCADIVIYSKEGAPLYVPVGEDQVSHVELSREIVRHFVLYFGLEVDGRLFSQENKNALRDAIGIFGQIGTPAQYVLSGELMPFERGLALTPETLSGAGPQLIAEQQRKGPSYPIPEDVKAYWVGRIKRKALEEGIDNFLPTLKSSRDFIRKRPTVLSEPDAMLTKTPRIPGLDGRKMSKSYGNTITLSETDEEIRKKTKVMVTDPARKRRTDPGNPDVCPVYDWHKLFSAEEPGRLEWVRQGCTTAGIGCIECKAAMAENLIKWIAPVRERRVKYEKNPKRVLEILDHGSNKARKAAQGTMERVREAVFGWEKKRAETDGTAGRAKA
jgi:tryptophanyl-tRNA synthetase